MSTRGRAPEARAIAGHDGGKHRGAGEARKHLTKVAIDCFARYGYQGTSIDRIASAAGVTKGALYYHFRDKEELLFAAVKDRIEEFEQRIVGAVTPLTDPAVALGEIARVCAHIATKNNLRRFILTLMVEALDTNPQLSQAFRDILRRFRGYLAGIVRQGQQDGVFRKDVDAGLAAALFAGGVVGAELQHYQDPERVDLALAMQGVVDQLVAWLASRATDQPAAVTRAARAERHPRRESR